MYKEDVTKFLSFQCPLTKQMILNILGSILLVPVTMETFPSMYEILNEALLNHVNTVFDIIPVFLNCSKHILYMNLINDSHAPLNGTSTCSRIYITDEVSGPFGKSHG